MEYYRYTGDEQFIRDHYQTLKGAAQFYVDFMTDYNGYKVVNPTLSPENQYYLPNSTTETAAITLGATMDTELLWELFGEIQELNSRLDLGDHAYVSKLNAIKAQLPPYRLNSFRGLQEWIHDYSEV
jgi:alpha-L-fucosidase 2